ncbi:hypothetical protein FUAX_48760 (plasmid) [Fulvitalea axinellae]|uniref:Uncharacterized protein n=1 Tax=Fulvitalea axinellae TaxID=1182444 RepID=A0AAU9D182_9BACT|nr:hypothetical protein FUAX_48760 [Fulvitalea axinellae]
MLLAEVKAFEANGIFGAGIPMETAQKIETAYRRNRKAWEQAFCEVLGLDQEGLKAVMSNRPDGAVFPEDALLMAFGHKSVALKEVWQRSDEALSMFVESLPAEYALTESQFELVLSWIRQQRDIRIPEDC